jgi:phosphohistidine phosphatase SixA
MIPDMTQRRTVLLGAALLPWAAQADETVAALLREGGAVIAFRHALAPGTFDPPQFKLGDCSTQRNLSDEGRAQARRIGQWLAQRQLVPTAVRSSPWCRCMDTATLAFGRAEAWAALGSPRGASESTNAESLRSLAAAVSAASRRRGAFEVWVTHQFVLNDLVRTSTTSGEGLVLRAGPGGQPQVLGRLAIG